MKILTYNTWHALNGEGLVRIGQLLSKSKNQRRRSKQKNLLSQLDADITFLQELNPVDELANSFAKSLNKSFSYLPVNAGIKYKKIGLPINLYSGLCILYNKDFNKVKEWEICLSGFGKILGEKENYLQVAESRKAFAVELQHPKQGSFLLVNCHFHHQPEPDPDIMGYLDQLVEKKDISQEEYIRLFSLFSVPQLRRQHESLQLMNFLSDKNHIDHIIVAGDFNCPFYAYPVRRMYDEFFEDAWGCLKGNSGGETFNGQKNCNIVNNLEKFNIIPFLQNEKWLDEKIFSEINKQVHKYEQKPRRIDYIFLKSKIKTFKYVEVFSGYDESLKMHLSDHFGLLACIS